AIMAVFRSIRDDINYAFNNGNMVTRLVIINFAVFASVNIFHFLLWLALGGDRAHTNEVFNNTLNWLCMPGDWHQLWRVWAPITSIFLHEGFWHFLNNIIGLYLFGKIVGDLVGDRRVLPIYLLGGLVGNALYLLSAQIPQFNVGYYALGASGAIMALAGTALILAPDYRVMLFLLGEVKLKYIVLVIVLLDLVGIANQSNTGGHAAHIGGFLFGCFFVYRLRDGKDMSEWVGRILDTIRGWFFRRPRRHSASKRRPQPAMKATTFGKAKGSNVSDLPTYSFQDQLDAILDKIKQQGYDSLSQEEKDFLYQASKK
ncbi:MAG: rhomboid family intramembrane serine protease, partial [Saprospiraceae bacterium]|nr:rhomboid family intramembrane serine protease [Saprospiraceae bacterium]